MEKSIKFFLMLFACLAMSVTFTSCGDDDDDEPKPAESGTSATTNTLVGTWVEKDVETMPFTLVLNSDHTGYMSYDTSARALLTDRFNWSTTEADGNTYLNIIHTSGDSFIYSIKNQYILAGNELILGFYYGNSSSNSFYQANFKRR